MQFKLSTGRSSPATHCVAWQLLNRRFLSCLQQAWCVWAVPRIKGRACQLPADSGRALLRRTALPERKQVVSNFIIYTDARRRPAVERFTGRVFQLPAPAFFARHAALLAGLRGLLVPGELQPHARALHQAACRHLTERWPARGEVCL